MSVALGMDVSEGRDDLAKEISSFRFAQSVLGNDVVKEFTARAILAQNGDSFSSMSMLKQDKGRDASLTSKTMNIFSSVSMTCMS